jgi:hypothetical protein
LGTKNGIAASNVAQVRPKVDVPTGKSIALLLRALSCGSPSLQIEHGAMTDCDLNSRLLIDTMNEKKEVKVKG